MITVIEEHLLRAKLGELVVAKLVQTVMVLIRVNLLLEACLEIPD